MYVTSATLPDSVYASNVLGTIRLSCGLMNGRLMSCRYAVKVWPANRTAPNASPSTLIAAWSDCSSLVPPSSAGP